MVHKLLFTCPFICSRFTIPVKTEDYSPDDDEGAGMFVLLRFTFTPSYPAEAPLVEVEESDNMEEEHLGRQQMGKLQSYQ